jgi:hypothetical protein
MISVWFNVEHYHNIHSTQYRCTHYTLLSTAWCFQSVCNSVTPWCVILLSTNSSTLVHPPVNFPPEPHHSRHPTAETFSWNADCTSYVAPGTRAQLSREARVRPPATATSRQLSFQFGARTPFVGFLTTSPVTRAFVCKIYCIVIVST